MPLLPKPSACFGCPLEHNGVGYVPGSGPLSPLQFLGEAPGYDEATASHRPFTGAAGGMHTRILRRLDLSRDAYRHENVLRCCPPGFEVKPQWAEAAAVQCAGHRQDATNAARVTVALGATAIRAALGLWNFHVDEVRVNDYHGTVNQVGPNHFVVPTFHPSHLQRGAIGLLNVVSFDIQTALEVLAGTWQADPIEPVIDPPLDWLDAYVREYEAAVNQDPFLPLSEDIETPDKETGKSEEELGEDDRSYQIDRWNFAYNDRQGVTFPNDPAYHPYVRRLHAAARIVMGWNHLGYDLRRTVANGFHYRPDMQLYDGMWLAHHLQTSLPLGLGFWAPLYSRHGAWKHLFSTNQGEYAAYDPVQAFRVIHGVVADLKASGQWHFAHRHTTILLQNILKPASDVGVQVDREKLDKFELQLTARADYSLTRLQEIVPVEERQLTPKGGLTRRPEGLHSKGRTTNTRTGEALANADDRDPLKIDLYAKYAAVVERQETRKVLCCASCGATEIQARHRCPDKTLTPQVGLRDVVVTRYYWREPFNPDSPQQVLAYILKRKHKPGRNKKTRNFAADRDTLTRLRATTGDPFYEELLDYRSVGKIRGTYAIGVRKRLDKDNRFHTTFTKRPSTLRTSATAPNIQNVASRDKAGENLASGFRACIIALDGVPSWAQNLSPEELAKYVDIGDT